MSAVVLCVGMIFAGQNSIHDDIHSNSYFVFGCLCLFLMFVLFYNAIDTINTENIWIVIFFLVWVLYPIAYKSPFKDSAYNILDIVSKAVFGIVVATITLLQ